LSITASLTCPLILIDHGKSGTLLLYLLLMMKKLTIFPAILIVFALLLAACQPVGTGTPVVTPPAGKSPMPTKTSAPTLTPVPEISVDPAKLDQVQIRVLHPWTEDTGILMTRLVDQFNQTNQWGIFVIEIAPGSAGLVQEKYRELLLDELAPDVLVVSPAQLLRSDALYGNILDLNPYLLSAKFGLFPEEQEDFLPVFWNESVVQGKRFGIPAQRTTEMLFYNVTWAKELGFTNPPSTWANFRQQVCAANASKRKDTDPLDDGLGGWIINTNALTTLSWLRTFGSDPLDKTNPRFLSVKSEEAFNALLKLSTDSCGWLSRLPQPYDYFTNRHALLYSGSMQDLLIQTHTNARLESEDEWIVIPYPTGEGESFVLTEGIDYGITASTDERQLAAWLFVRWLSSPNQQAWFLRNSGTLPLGEAVLPMVSDLVEDYPVWGEAVKLSDLVVALPASKDLDIIKTVVEDGGWQLFKTGLKSDAVQTLLSQIDMTIAEMTARKE
jgi:multiple sugar transport system substrate-binding protein/sn-glycerol 3-phosphate transport system substrate-binding protein